LFRVAKKIKIQKGVQGMSKLLGLILAGVILIGGVSVYAGGGCCAAGAKADAKCSNGDSFAKMTLTDDQKTKIEALRAECKKDQCSAAAMEKMDKGLKETLTAEQYQQWKDACTKAKAGGCPFAGKAAKKETKS
jgi:hypothetical protein